MSRLVGDDDREALLAECLVFRALGDADRSALAARTTRSSYPAGSAIFHLGDAGHTMMVVAKGTVRVSLPTSAGKEIILADLDRGAVLGEVAVLDGKPRSATATALTNCELLKLERSALKPCLYRDPGTALALVELLCDRLRRSDERMVDIGLTSLPERLARALLRRFDEGSRKHRKALSQTELADMVGSTRESVNRALRAWHRDGIVQLDNGWIEIKRQDALSALAGVW